MDDRLRETLSAMMDDEADELSVRRLLSHPDQDQVRDQWQRWQQVRDLMHHGQAPEEGIDVSQAVREVLEGRAGDALPARDVAGTPAPRWRWPAVAMVALATVIGFGVGAGWNVEPEGSGITVATAGSPATAVTGTDRGESSPVQEVALHGLDKQQWEQMSRYLLEHAQHNSVGAGRGSVGYARLVSANGNGY